MVSVELKQEVIEKELIRQSCSHKDFARRMGVSRSYLSAVCNGRIKPSLAMRQRLLEYFRCSFDDLFVIRDGDGSE